MLIFRGRNSRWCERDCGSQLVRNLMAIELAAERAMKNLHFTVTKISAIFAGELMYRWEHEMVSRIREGTV